jgi:signal transduction histidine kinase
MHRLLERQIRKALKGRTIEDADLQALLQAIDAAYVTADEDHRQLERSLNLASEELFERHRRLEVELEERKRLELELRLAEKLRAVGQLAAGVAHEINTPVQFISDSVEFLRTAFADIDRLLETCQPLLTATHAADGAALRVKAAALSAEIDLPFLRFEAPRALARCAEGTQRVTRIVKAMKELAHPDRSFQEPADLNAAIANTLLVAAHEIKYVAEVETELQAKHPVLCHLGEIQQVLLNLIVNAGHAIGERVGASGEKGKIRITTRDEGEEFVFTIEDNGAGMPDTVRERIFEPFFTTKPVGKGTGQGLSIARTLVVDRHRGQIDFISTPGVGTSFIVRLPIPGRDSLETEQAAQSPETQALSA